MTQSTSTPKTGSDLTSIELDIQGMTCASCAARIEKKLNKVEGVSATVNYATERAHVLAPPGGAGVEDLIAVVEKTGYGASIPDPEAAPVDHSVALRRRLIISAILSIPVIAMAMIEPLQFPGWQWLSLALTIPVVTWAAWPFHKSAAVNARHRATTMDTLISMGTTAAFLWSIYALFFTSAGTIGFRHGFDFSLNRHHASASIYFEAAVGIITFLLAGRYIESRSRREAGAALKALLGMGAKEATILREGAEMRVPISEVAVGDEFVVRPGEKIATDGEVIEGFSAVDASLMTGESVPVEVGPHSLVAGATINASGRLVVRATAVGSDTQLSHIARLVEQAQTGKAQVQRLADKISGIFVPIVIALSLATLITWLALGQHLEFAITAAVAVLIIACPCALGLATPTALLAGTGRGAELGIVIRGAEVLEQARAIGTIVLDKTGTLTSGDMSLTSTTAAEGVDEQTLLRVAAGLESASEHPIALAIVAGYSGPVPAVSDFANQPGRGVRGLVEGRLFLAGNPAMIAEAGLPIPTELSAALEKAADLGASCVLVADNERVLGVLSVQDTIKPTSVQAVAEFKKLGLTPVMLTGDNGPAARAVASAVGIDQVHHDVLPADKLAVIAQLQQVGAGRNGTNHIAMVGDGVNDAAALTKADLGMAMGSGTDAAIAASDITLMRPDLLLAADAIRLARATLRTIKVNLFWAFFYNVVALPIAALGFLTPMFAGAAMAFSSVFVVGNSLLLRRFTPRH